MISCPGCMVIETSSMWSASLCSLRVRIAFADRRHQAGIVRAQHLDDGIVFAQLAHAVGCGEAPRRLVPRHSQGWKAVPVVRNIDVRLYPRHGVHQLANAFHAAVPFAVNFLFIQIQPGLKRGQAADDFFFPDFHGAAHGSFTRAVVHQGRLDQVLSTQEQSAALRSA